MDMDGDQSLGERGTPESVAQAAADEGVIEGGSVSDFQKYKWEPEKKHRAETARYLAYGLVGIIEIPGREAHGGVDPTITHQGNL